jgi:hypothetical protein
MKFERIEYIMKVKDITTENIVDGVWRCNVNMREQYDIAKCSLSMVEEHVAVKLSTCMFGKVRITIESMED